MSAREVEAAIKRVADKKDKEEKKPARDIHLEAMEDRMALSLGTQVRIKDNGGKGKILVDFYSHADLERLLELFSATGQMETRKPVQSFTV
jgi:hypothetical protein